LSQSSKANSGSQDGYFKRLALDERCIEHRLTIDAMRKQAIQSLICDVRADGSVFLYAFDLIELNGDDLRREPLEVRKGSSPRSGQDCPWPPMNLRTQSEWMRARVAANRDIGI
jgi:hypothetical protein